MATNTAFGTLPSPITQLFGGNAGGGMAGAPPVKPKTQAQPAQQGMAPGTTPTFAQLQQQGQARPAPAAAAPVQQPPQQPPMLSALGAQLNQPTPQQQQQPVQPPAAKRQFTPQELANARERYKGLQEEANKKITDAANQWGTVGGFNVGGSIRSALEGGGGASGFGSPFAGVGGVSFDENGLPTATYAPPGGTAQTIRQDFPEELRQALEAANAEDEAAAAAAQAAQPQQAPMEQAGQQMSAMPYGATEAPLPAYQSSGAFGGSSQAQVLRSRLEQQLNDLSQNEAQIQGQSYAALRKAKMDEMGAEFGAQRSQLEEDLARRGLSASTIGGGRYGDLAGQQARATASFEADLLKQQAEAEAENRKVYLSGMSELAGMAGQQDLGAFEANLKSRQADADISLRTQELQQKAALEGRSLNLQEARDLATKEYQGGQLQQGYAEISSRERMSASDIAARQQMQQSQFGFDKEQSQLERDLRKQLQEGQITAEGLRQLTQINANKELQTDSQKFQGEQSVLERKLREDLQKGQITAEGQRQLAQIDADKARQTERIAAEKSLQESQQTWQAGQTAAGNVFQAAQSQLDRDLRTTLSANELGQAKAQFDQRFGLEKGQSDNQFLASLAQALAPMKQADRDAFLASLGIKKPSPTAPGSPSTDTGGF